MNKKKLMTINQKERVEKNATERKALPEHFKGVFTQPRLKFGGKYLNLKGAIKVISNLRYNLYLEI